MGRICSPSKREEEYMNEMYGKAIMLRRHPDVGEFVILKWVLE
jgi:hypothetical protein